MHDATLSEVNQFFATNERRLELYDGLLQGCRSLETAGCLVCFLDGSYVTSKPIPGDYDVCWDPADVDEGKLDPVLLDFTDQRMSRKMKYGGEFFPSSARADGSRSFVEYFQIDKETGLEKGIICIHLPQSAERLEE